jgi:O-acetylserine/cysteine efflux transporter
MTFRHFLIVLLIVNIWAFNVIAIKIGVTELPPLLMTLLRFVVVAVIIVPFTRINREQFKSVAIQAFTFGFLHFSLLFVGMQYTDAGTAAVLVQLGTPFAMILAVFFLHEKLHLLQVFGISLSFVGVFCLSGSPSSSSWIALTLLITSAMGWAITNIVVKKSPEIHPMTMAGWMSFLAIPIVGLSTILVEHHQLSMLLNASWKGWFAILYSALASSIFAYSLWYWLLKIYPVNKVVPYSLLNPVIAIFMGWIFLGDSLNLYKLIGSGLIIGGAFIAQYNFKRFFKRKVVSV